MTPFTPEQVQAAHDLAVSYAAYNRAIEGPDYPGRSANIFTWACMLQKDQRVTGVTLSRALDDVIAAHRELLK